MEVNLWDVWDGTNFGSTAVNLAIITGVSLYYLRGMVQRRCIWRIRTYG
jgi:hypothetical protein